LNLQKGNLHKGSNLQKSRDLQNGSFIISIIDNRERRIFRVYAPNLLIAPTLGKSILMEKKKSTPGWGACKAAMRNWPQPGMLALIQELYELSDDNRRFLRARLLPEQAGQTLEETKRRVEKLLTVDRIFANRFSHSDVKKVIDQYAKASDDPAAVAELLITDLEMSFDSFAQVGDYDAMVDHLYSTFGRLDKVLKTLPKEKVVLVAEQLDDLAAQWEGKFGYGISDELSDMAADWHKAAGL
jgi:hypothetical protein